MNSGVQGGFVTIGEARQSLGLMPDAHNVYLRPLNMVAVAEGDTGIVPRLKRKKKHLSTLQDSNQKFVELEEL